MAQNRLHRALYHWHRRLGVVAALLVVLLAVTGILLNHTDRLGLVHRPVTNALLLDWYGIRSPEVPPGWQANGHWFATLDGILFLDDRPVAEAKGTLRGVVALPALDAYLLAFDQDLLLLDRDGRVIEWMPPPAGLDGRILGLAGPRDGLPVLVTRSSAWIPDPELAGWRRLDDASGLVPLPPAMLPETLGLRIAQRARSRRISMERLLLDLHSGRLFGRHGPWVMDGAAVLLLLLALSGGFLWLRQLWKRHRHRHR